jgi:hypothetical protein
MRRRQLRADARLGLCFVLLVNLAGAELVRSGPVRRALLLVAVGGRQDRLHGPPLTRAPACEEAPDVDARAAL